MSLFDQIAQTANPENLIPKTRTDGTTDEQWERYEAEVKAHEKFIERYRFYLERIVNHLELNYPRCTWTPAKIKEFMTAEIDKSSSMDAPNKPGYYRANND
jgi:hypothetical protein